MKVLVSLATVVGLFLVGLFGGLAGLGWIFGVVFPALAIVLFLGGLIYRVLVWAKVPVPFHIPTTCGQQKSLDWIKRDKLENPHSTLAVIGRMALEILFFRSLLRNTRSELVKGRWLIHGPSVALWVGALAMHWSLLIVLTRHLRLFTVPVPGFVTYVQSVDRFVLLQVGTPVLFVSSIIFVAALSYLLVRRLVTPQLRYISLANDYLPLFLLLGIALSGLWLRHIDRTDVPAVKELAVGLLSFSPVVPDTIGSLFYGHLFLVSVLLAYFPLSKLLHMPGIFLSPTRNLSNNSRVKRHINPWDYPVKLHTYEEYEDELREKMKAAGIPVEKE